MATILRPPAAGSGGRVDLSDLLATATLEIIPLASAVESARTLPPGTTVAVTASPAKGQQATIDAAVTLARAGLRPVPHLAAHLMESPRAVRGHLDRLAAAGIGDVFVIGGDGPQRGPLADGLALLETILEVSDRPWRIGIPCYPEGHPRIHEERLLDALRAKAPHASYMTSQLSFNPRAVGRWLAARRAEGITLPLHLGLPGATDPLRLLRIAARIGVRDSRRFLAKNSALVGRLLATLGFYRPERLLEAFAQLIEDPTADVRALHLYTFDGVAATARWRAAYLERRRARARGEPSPQGSGTAMDPPAERRRLLDAVAAVPDRLAALAEAAASVRPAPGAWSAHEIVRHLVAVERVVWQPRFRDLARAAEDAPPPFWPWTQPELEPSLATVGLGEAIAAFRAQRAATLALAAGLDAAGWTRYGIHAVFGRLDAAGLLTEVLRHDEEHLQQLEALSADREA